MLAVRLCILRIAAVWLCEVCINILRVYTLENGGIPVKLFVRSFYAFMYVEITSPGAVFFQTLRCYFNRAYDVYSRLHTILHFLSL